MFTVQNLIKVGKISIVFLTNDENLLDESDKKAN